MRKGSVSFGVGGVNVRKSWTVSSKRLDALAPGHEVEIDRERDGWVHLRYRQLGEDREGWSVLSAFVIEPEEGVVPAEPTVPAEPAPKELDRGFVLLVGFGVLMAAIFLAKVFLHIN